MKAKEFLNFFDFDIENKGNGYRVYDLQHVFYDRYADNLKELPECIPDSAYDDYIFNDVQEKGFIWNAESGKTYCEDMKDFLENIHDDYFLPIVKCLLSPELIEK